MDALLRLIGFLSIPLVAVSVFIMVRGMGSEYRLRMRGLVMTAGFAVAVLWLFRTALDVEPTWTAWALAVAGVVAGAVVGRATPLRVAGGEVFAQRTPWSVGAWLLCFGYAQLAVLGVLPGEYEGGLEVMLLATGVAVGTSVSLAVRRSQARAATADAVASATGGICAHCGRPNPDMARFCSHCGWHVVRRGDRNEATA